MSSPIHHLALAAEWDHAVANGEPYRRSTIGRSLEEEGFIHCSFAHQIQGVADDFYRSRDDVVLLTIDADALSSPVVIENLAGGSEGFPHVYGPITLSAVVGATKVGLSPDGRLDLDTALRRQS
jgi:uncharacterized protein (DUF952 family)